MADCLHIRCEVFPTCQIDPPADPTPSPAPAATPPAEELRAIADAVPCADHGHYRCMCLVRADDRRAAIYAAGVAAGRTAAAAAILGKITEKQAEIDAPDTDAEVLSTLIDECEGLWMALRAADPATFHREHAAARIAEGKPDDRS